MTTQQEHDLRDAFEKALRELRSGGKIEVVENIYGQVGKSAVVLVVGQGVTFDVVHAVYGIMAQREKKLASGSK